ncbi:hypothetical protein RLEG12_00545 (plasmid) [Rhizobium leguminosarum bv. trifolii CB782]|nr:hypothetical protein RLEG12_00545 [Rhizobium leguminosarum bv. trifolii CB782]
MISVGGVFGRDVCAFGGCAVWERDFDDRVN